MPQAPILSLKKVEKYNEGINNRGVLYMSRIPPFMKPEKVRHLLSAYGTIHRLYLVPEESIHRTKRVLNGGNRKVNYIEGWIEFNEKKIAKRVAKLLNTNPMGGKKRNHFFDDLWNLKYLKGFQWNHLTEKIGNLFYYLVVFDFIFLMIFNFNDYFVAYENRIREQKLRLEIAQGTKENHMYLERVEQSQMVNEIVKRKEKAEIKNTVHREFKQRLPME